MVKIMPLLTNLKICVKYDEEWIMEDSLKSREVNLVPSKKLGEILVSMGLCTSEQLTFAEARAKTKNVRIGELLVSEGLIKDHDLAKALATQNGLEYIDLNSVSVSNESANILPEKMARTYKLLPLESKNGVITLVTHNPISLVKIGNLDERLHATVVIKVATEVQIDSALDKVYVGASSIDRIIKHLSNKHQEQKSERKLKEVTVLTAANNNGKDQFSVESLVNTFIEKAMHDRASDIHLDPTEKKVRVRIRIDGVLHELYSYPIEIHSTVVSRLKVLAQLDISEKRQPQDGSFQHSRNSITIDIRTSTLPTVYGEKVVLRLLDKEKMKSTLSAIGMSAQMEKEILTLLQRPYGIMFITGPTGSGKTTTLYSMLNLIDGVENNIITVEDPVEYKFDVVNQVQVNEKAGLNFSSLLRNILRQDPDVVMVGEVRDQETADLAIRAALTGHMVLTTIHTNDSVSTPTRLIDMKVEPFLLASGLSAVLAQRLVRVLCKHCKQKVQLTKEDVELLGSDQLHEGDWVYGPKGCDHCLKTGYLNRIALFELITVNDPIRRMITEDYSEIEMKKYLMQTGFTTMRQDGVGKILAGITTVDEVLKATI